MKTQRLEEILNQTLDDSRLSRSEKKALEEIMGEETLDDTKRALWLHKAFEVARKRIHDPRDGDLLEWFKDMAKLLSSGSHEKSVISEAHFSPGEACRRRVIGLLDGARRKIDICVFTITDNLIADAIIRAQDRSVDIRIITDDEKIYDIGSDIDRFRASGVPTRMDNSAHHMHHKFAVFDETVLLTGSYNWTRSAAVHNQENVVVTDNPHLVSRFCHTFEELWAQFQ